MTKTPVILAILVTGAGIAGAVTLFRGKALQLSSAEMMQSVLAIVTIWGAFLSAIFVVYSYLQTNHAFVESQRPQLLIQIENQFVQGPETSQKKPVTIIHYRNISTNMFRDLTIKVYVLAGDREVDLSELFKPKMVMVGTDQRQRRFEPAKLLAESSLDLDVPISGGRTPVLRFSYSYTYNGRVDIVELQEYKWNPALQAWEIM